LSVHIKNLEKQLAELKGEKLSNENEAD